MEISTNAVFVFLPSKPALLALATLGREPSNWETFLFSNCFALGLGVPIGVALHAYFAMTSLFSAPRSGRLHAHHMLCAMCWIIGPGVMRLIIQMLWEPLGIRPFEDNVATIGLQNVSFFLTYPIIVICKLFFYSSLSPDLRKSAGVEIMRRFWIIHPLWGAVACWMLEVDLWPVRD